jgi:hypothetical protein
MVSLGWKSLTETPPAGEPGRTVSAPIEHQGVRNALRGAFREADEETTIPEDMRQLLARLH